MSAWSGSSSYEQIQRQMADAVADAGVSAILLDIDSPGGETAGCFDVADFIFSMRKEKPVWAAVTYCRLPGGRHEETLDNRGRLAADVDCRLLPISVDNCGLHGDYRLGSAGLARTRPAIMRVARGSDSSICHAGEACKSGNTESLPAIWIRLSWWSS